MDAGTDGKVWSSALIVLIVGLSAICFIIVLGGTFDTCSPGKFTNDQHKTLAFLDSIVDLGLKLATALVGFGAAVLIGIKPDLKLTLLQRVLIAGATLWFAESALYGIWWRFGLAEVYFNRCFGLVSTTYIHSRFQAHLGTFILGVLWIGILVISATYKNPKQEYDT